MNIEELYEQYHSRGDINKIINGRKYTRIAGSSVIDVCNQRLFNIYIDKTINCKIGDLIEDEHGNHFTVEGMGRTSFLSHSSKRRCHILMLEISSSETDEIGEYVIVC